MRIKVIKWSALFILLLVISVYILKKNLYPYKYCSDHLISIIPHPQELSVKGDSLDFVINNNSVIVIKDTATSEDKILFETLNKALDIINILPIRIISAKDFSKFENAIVIGELENDFNLLDSLVISRKMLQTPPYFRPEEYRLDVDPQFTVIVGKDKAASFFGVQTLIQLLKNDNNTNECKVSSVRITDFPDMPIRGIYYGFHFGDLDDTTQLERGYRDIYKFAKYKLNMIGLDNNHYGHLEMEIPDGSGEKYYERLKVIFDHSKKYHLKPRIGGWTRWFGSDSKWSSNPTTLEGIRTIQTIELKGTKTYPLRISSGHIAKKVIHDFESGNSWSEEPVIVTDDSGVTVYKENIDYTISFGKIESVFYDNVISGEGEPAGYPLRRGKSCDQPTLIKRTKNSHIKDGQKVKVSFSYIGPDPWTGYKIRYCRSDPRLHTDGPENFIWRWCTQPIKYLNANIFNLEMDEIRVFAWDKRCLDSGKSRSQIFADDIKYYYNTIRKYQPKSQIMMWCDMLDPFHNAKLYRTQQVIDILTEYGMDDIIMVPWNYNTAEESIDFFSNRGFSVVASSQEQINKMSVAPKWAKYLRHRFENKDKIYGIMHAPWDYDYDTADGIERLETCADYAWSVAPYIIHSPIKSSKSGNEILVETQVKGDKFVYDGKEINKGPLPITSANLCYRLKGLKQFVKIKMKKYSGKYCGTIPAYVINSTNVEYYLEISDKNHTSFSPKSAPAIPYEIKLID